MAQMTAEEKMAFFCTAQCFRLDRQALQTVVFNLLSENRIPHVCGCAETAVQLARQWGEKETDAWRAGMLHDVTKALDGPQQLELCRRLALPVDEFSQENPKTLHQLTGAVVAQRVFGESEAVCQGIRFHTTGCAGMTTLQKIIYIADYIEPNRRFDGVEDLRRLAVTDLNAAMHLGLQMTMNLLKEQGKAVCSHSLAAINDLEKEIVKC